MSGTYARSSVTAASVSSVGTSPAQAITTSGSPASLLAQCQMPGAGGAVADGRVDVEPLPLRLLAGDDQVDVVAAAQAVIGDRQQAVGVGRQIDARDVGLLVGDVIDEARVLVGEAVVVLPPDMGGEQVVQRRDRLAPRDCPADLQPLGVLVEHRIDDVDEGLVAGEEAVAAGEQVAFQPALAQVLAQHLHHAARRG